MPERSCPKLPQLAALVKPELAQATALAGLSLELRMPLTQLAAVQQQTLPPLRGMVGMGATESSTSSDHIFGRLRAPIWGELQRSRDTGAEFDSHGLLPV